MTPHEISQAIDLLRAAPADQLSEDLAFANTHEEMRAAKLKDEGAANGECHE